MKNKPDADNAEYFQLCPRGTKKNDPCSTEVPAADPEIASMIKDCRRTFMETVKGSQNNQQNVYRILGRKIPFIVNHLPDNHSSEVLDAILADRSTLFSDDYANAQINRSVIGSMLRRYGKTPEEVHDYCAELAWLEYCSQVRAEAREDQDIVMDVLRQFDSIARRTSNGIEYYRNKLSEVNNAADEGQEAQALLHAMKDWELHVTIRQNRIVGFYVHCFNSYCNKRREYRLLKDEYGRFKPSYTKKDEDVFVAYQKRKNQLTAFRKACTKWNRQNNFPFSEAEQMAETTLPSDFDQASFLQLVGGYLAEVRGKNEPNEEQALKALRYAFSNHDLAPIRFLIICVHNRNALISYRNGTHRDLDLNDIRGFEQYVYRKTPSVDKQRISRLKLLTGLCKLLDCSKEQVQNNLMYFLKYHGYGIAAEEEAAIWKQTLEEYEIMNEPVSLALRYYTNRQECILFDPRALYCYEFCSQLHLGGWLSFTEDDLFCRLLEDKAHKKQIKIDNENEYLEDWGSDEPNIGKIKALCSKAAQQQENIKAITEWIQQWDDASRRGEHRTKHIVVPDEFYSLLIESAIQHKLMKQAQNILLDKINKAIPRK